MNLLCGPNSITPNNDTLFQFEEGQRAHTIKFLSNRIKLNLNSINNTKISKQNITKNINSQYNKEILIKNKTPMESNKCSNNTSELEIIEYPINEFKKNDLKNINDIISSKAKDYINDKSQNDILDYLKEKQGLNYLSLLLENDKYSNNSKSENNENEENSSKSDEIICSYVEIDHNNSIISRMKKEKSAIKQSSKIFSQIHQATYSDYDLSIKNYDSTNNKILKTINVDKSNNKNDEKKIKIKKNIKKNKTDMKFKKKINPINNSNINTYGYLKKNHKKKENVKSFLDIMPCDNNNNNDTYKNNDINKNNDTNKHKKRKIIFEKKLHLDTFRSIEYLNNINPIHSNYKNALNNHKGKKSWGKSQIINSERAKNIFQINKNINTKSRDKNTMHIYKTAKGNSINNKSKNKINSKGKINKNENPLFNSITLKTNKNLNIKKGNFLSLKKGLLSSMNIDSKKKMKTGNKTNTIANSKTKLRKLLLKNPINNKHKCDLSMYNIKSISNNTKLLIKKEKEKNKTLNKIMNKSEANKKINNSIQLKNNSHNNDKQFKNNLMQTSISKIFKGS